MEQPTGTPLTPENQVTAGTTSETPSELDQLRKELADKDASYKALQAQFTKDRQDKKKAEDKSIEKKYGLDAYDTPSIPEEMKDVINYVKDIKANEELNSFTSSNGVDAETKTKLKDTLAKYPSLSMADALVLANGSSVTDDAVARARAEEETKRIAAGKTFSNAAPSVDVIQSKINNLTEAQLTIIRKTGMSPEKFVQNLS